jgi:hypothetical protein
VKGWKTVEAWADVIGRDADDVCKAAIVTGLAYSRVHARTIDGVVEYSSAAAKILRKVLSPDTREIKTPAQALRERQGQRWERTKDRLEAAKPLPAMTIEELREVVERAEGLGLAAVQLHVQRSRPPGVNSRGKSQPSEITLPLVQGGRRRRGPKSDPDRSIAPGSGPGQWAAWWRVADLRAWLRTKVDR